MIRTSLKLKICALLNTWVKRMKRQATAWEESFVNHISDKGLECGTYRELSKLSSKKIIIIIQIRKWTKDMNKHLTKKNIEMANMHMKSCLSLAIRGTRIKTTMKCHHMSMRLGTIKTPPAPHAAVTVQIFSVGT